MLRHRYEHAKHIEPALSKGVFDASNIEPLFAALSDDVVNDDAYDEAAREGVHAVPDVENGSKPDAAQVAEIWLGKTRRYAAQFPARIASEVSKAAYDAERQANADGLSDDDRVDAVVNAAADKIEALRSDALLYAEPPWGAGNHGYGAALDAVGVLIDWDIEPEACPECAVMPEGNPYTLAALPMWPGDPHPNCRCHITPDDQTWESIFGDAAA